MKISSIGGNVSCNSGGLRGLKYGVTKDYVMGFELVLPNGDVTWIGNKCVKDVAGYSLREVFIGSEGTLGIFTKILLRLLPKPAAKKTLLATLREDGAGRRDRLAIIAHPIIPCTLEFLDRTTIKCVEDFAHVGLPLEAEAVLLMETDGHPAVVAEEADIMAQLARKNGAMDVRVAKDSRDRCGWPRRGARRFPRWPASPRRPSSRTSPSRAANWPGWLRSSRRSPQRHNLRIGVFGHMGDGNLHPTFLTNEKNADEMHRVELAFQEIVDRNRPPRRHDHRRTRRRPRQERNSCPSRSATSTSTSCASSSASSTRT